MRRDLLLVGGVLLGGVGLLFVAAQLVPQLGALLRGKPQQQGGGDGSLLGDVVAPVVGLVGQVIDKVDWSKAGSKASDAGKKALSVIGLASDPDKKKEAQKAQNAAVTQILIDMEEFAARTHQLLARADVKEWVLSSSGVNGSPTFDVYLVGKDQPTRIEVPERAVQHRLAWAAEPIVRTLGVFVQRGRRIGVPWVRYDLPAYSDNNPHAIPGLRLSEQRATADAYLRKHGLIEDTNTGAQGAQE